MTSKKPSLTNCLSRRVENEEIMNGIIRMVMVSHIRPRSRDDVFNVELVTAVLTEFPLSLSFKNRNFTVGCFMRIEFS